MRKQLIVKTRSLTGVSDLTIAAPLKPGLVPSLETLTYRSRAKAVLRVLNSSRSSSHEYSLLRTYSDSVERVGQIQSVRIAVIGDLIMLAATYDGNLEAYVRVLYGKVGGLLDLVFCNTEGHVGAHDHSFEHWRDWVTRSQVETDMFYAMPGLTYDDVQYLQTGERRERTRPDSDLAATAQRVASAEQRALAAVASGPSCPHQAAAAAANAPWQRTLGQLELVKQGMQALAVLYRLADHYLPGTPDGHYLQRAAQDLLLELKYFDTVRQIGPADPGLAGVRQRFDRQLAWLEQPVPRQPPGPPAQLELPDGEQVQGGILTAYPPGITHGALVLVHLGSRAAAAGVLAWLGGRLWLHGRQDADPRQPLVTAAFSAEGLRACGLDDAEIELFPQEFREGMEARCSLLGDLHINHPRRWRLPRRNWGADLGSTVEMAAVHLVVQLRISQPEADEFDDVANERHPLHVCVAELAHLHDQARVLAVQPMRRAELPGERPHEHFGFADPVSNPVLVEPPARPQDQAPRHYDARLPLGEALLGHANQADPARDRPDELNELLRNGSFLVVRKLRQDVARFQAVAEAGAVSSSGSLRPDEVKERLMGRRLDGGALVARVGVHGNDFNYDADPTGAQCPLQSHVRRANPRIARPAGASVGSERPPFIVRRGMSYGPPYDRRLGPHEGRNGEERGMVFMAYNASIAEQFEVIQRWLAGGNSTGIASSQADPILGVPHPGDLRTVRYSHDGVVDRVALDDRTTGSDAPGASAPLVRLEWGIYLFAPSAHALALLQARTSRPTPAAVPWDRRRGRALVDQLRRQVRALPADERAGTGALLWKAALEDPEQRRDDASASIWAHVRNHTGVLDTGTDYGVLVGGRQLVHEVLADDQGRYSMSGHLGRMRDSLGEIYLGLDRDPADPACEYTRLATAVNDAIQSLDPEQVYRRAQALATARLDLMLRGTLAQARAYGLPTWELNLDLKEIGDAVLAGLSQDWLGVFGDAQGRIHGQAAPFAPGSYRWDWQAAQPPLVPGHFTWPSRYIFQPLPGPEVVDYGRRYGQAVRAAALTYTRAHRDAGSVPPGELAAAIFAAFPARADDALVARTVVGTLMGFLPTVDGNLRATLNEWLSDGSFWALRQAAGSVPLDLAGARRVVAPALRASMQLRPMPELLWRTAVRAHELNGVRIEAGRRVVVGLVSATQRGLEDASDDGNAVFGGTRQRCPVGAPWPAGQPTHACPGREAAVAVLLGIITALLQAPGQMRASPVPLSVTFLGDVPVA